MKKIGYNLPIFEDTDKADLNKYSTEMAGALKVQLDKFGNPLIFKGTVQTLEELDILTNMQNGYILGSVLLLSLNLNVFRYIIFTSIYLH